MQRSRMHWWWLAAALVCGGSGTLLGCHLVLGLETAETLDGDEQCSSAADCDDGNLCTQDSCVTVCVHTPLDGVDLPRDDQVDYDCMRSHCQNGLLLQLVDDTDLPLDEKQCTNDVCSGGVPANPPVTPGTSCTDDGGSVCGAAGDCVECHSNTDCSSPDTCGGGGTTNECGCTPSQSCVVEGYTCGFLTDTTCGGSIVCNNQMMDGNETDVDCGGAVSSCSLRCADGKSCAIGSDCASGSCIGNLCVP